MDLSLSELVIGWKFFGFENESREWRKGYETGRSIIRHSEPPIRDGTSLVTRARFVP